MKINKKYFKKSMFIILSTIVALIIINIFCNHLIINGLDSLFTTNAYKTAFENTDTSLINAFRWIGISFTIASAYINLEYNAELLKIEKEEKYWIRKEMKI